MTNQDIQIKLNALPHSPGVYQFFDKSGEIIYVGKAKNLKSRVSSYFQKNVDRYKTRVLVSKVVDFKYIVVDTEDSALLLENNLIKKYKPKYNILLKDDKSYPWVCITKERFPRVFMTRKVDTKKARHYGPYTRVKMVRSLVELIKEVYPTRSCNFELSQDKINAGKYQICLDYHIKKCFGPCENRQSESDYMQNIRSIEYILKGNINKAIGHFQNKMKEYAQNLEFEKAQETKEKIDELTNYQSRSTIVNPTIHNVDVFMIWKDIDYFFYSYLKINNGSIIQAYTSETKSKLDEQEPEVLGAIITEIRQRFKSTSKEVILPFEVPFLSSDIRQTVPSIGDKKKLLDMSERNLKFYRMDFRKQQKAKDPEKHTNRILETLKVDLSLDEHPRHIECFDNSNIQGTSAASACVVFKNTKPSKKEYRHFNIKTVDGPDDYASMYEVVYRRYKSLKDKGEPLPQLVVIDGGKGQLNSAYQALKELDLEHNMAIIGIAKRLEEIYFPNESIPIYLDKTSESLKVIQHARNEAHRFSLRHHRQLRHKNSFGSILEQIDGIGTETAKKLLIQFGSVKRIKESELSDITKVIGKSKAQLVFDYLRGEQDDI